MKQAIKTILVTGATGYVGGRLVPRLLQAGYNVRVMIRGDASRLNGRFWQDKVDFATAVKLALKRIDKGDIETLWSDALASSQGDIKPVHFTQEQEMLIERRQKQVQAPATAVYRAFLGLGGQRGWPPYNWLWQIRGALDRLVGGVGMRRGRRHPDELRQGEALDFWRVEKVEPDRLLRLRAEMKLPGQGWLQYEVNESVSGSSD